METEYGHETSGQITGTVRCTALRAGVPGGDIWELVADSLPAEVSAEAQSMESPRAAIHRA